MKIYPGLQIANQHNNERKKATAPTYSQQSFATANTLVPNFNDYLLAFTARVDKGLDRFYETNKIL